jgi:hypothetical protein
MAIDTNRVKPEELGMNQRWPEDPDNPDNPDDDEAPETPLDEPPPVPIQDPPPDGSPEPPLTARHCAIVNDLTRRMQS